MGWIDSVALTHTIMPCVRQLASGKCRITQGAQLSALNDPEGWEGESRARGYIYTYGRFAPLYGRNEHNTVKQLYIIKKKNSACTKGQMGI